MFAKLKELMTRQKLVSRAQDMSARDLADLGVSREQLIGLVKLPEAVPARMAQMATVFDADLNTLQRSRDTFLQAVEACHHCNEARTCRETLAHQATGGCSASKKV